MNASELVEAVGERFDFNLHPNNDESAVIVKIANEQIFYFSIPHHLADDEIEKELLAYLEVKQGGGFPVEINGKPAVLTNKFPKNGLQVSK